MSDKTILLKNAIVLTMDDDYQIFEPGAVAVQGDQIAAVGDEAGIHRGRFTARCGAATNLGGTGLERARMDGARLRRDHIIDHGSLATGKPRRPADTTREASGIAPVACCNLPQYLISLVRPSPTALGIYRDPFASDDPLLGEICAEHTGADPAIRHDLVRRAAEFTSARIDVHNDVTGDPVLDMDSQALGQPPRLADIASYLRAIDADNLFRQ